MKLNETIIIERGKGDFKLDTDGAMKLRATFIRSGVKNENGRTYPKSEVKGAVAEFKSRLVKQPGYGSTGHPKELELDQISHLIEDVELDEKGNASAVLKIVPTTRGRNLQTLLRHGASIGLSARGRGEVGSDGVVRNYRLEGIDFVASPSFDTHANLGNVFESVVPETKKIEVIHDVVMPSEDEILRRYNLAVSQGIVKTSFEKYRKTYRADPTIADRYATAVREAGYRGTLAQYAKDVMKKST